MLWLPTESVAVVKTAARELLTVALPSWVVPSKKVTVPVGAAVPPPNTVTVAVKVTF